MHDRMRLERGADALLRALDLERAGHDAAHGTNFSPFIRELVVAPGGWHLGKSFQMDGFCALAKTREPGLLGGEAKHRRKPRHRAAEQMIEHGETGLAFYRGERIAIESVLADVEIKCRQVRGHETRERG